MQSAGAIQRFSLGFRGPLCLVCGFTGVAPSRFALGAAVGALGTMPLQILVVSWRHAFHAFIVFAAVHCSAGIR